MSFFRNQILFRKKGFRNQRSYLFDGGGEYININAVRTALATTTTGTWSCWVKPVDATPVDANMLISFANGNTTDMLYIAILATTGLMRSFCINDGVNQWALDTSSAPFSDNVWAHCAVVQNGTEPVLYVNGVAPAQTFPVTTNKTVWVNGLSMNNGRIACRFWSVAEGDGALSFNGNIDEVRFWNRALSAAEILDDYNNRRPKRPNTNGLISYFHFDGDPFDGTNFSVRDHIGNNHGATVNMEYDDLELDVPPS